MSQALKFAIALAVSLMATASQAIDLGNESMADKADRFDFEEFHKEKGITIWQEKKEKNTTTYEEGSQQAKPAPAAATVTNTVVTTPVASQKTTVTQKSFEKGDELKVREAYKLGNDPALRNIQSLFDATEALHQQLNGYCPNGWAKDSEWHKPEQNYFYIHYSAVCL